MKKKVTTTTGKPIETAPEPGKVLVTDAEGKDAWVWPVDAREIAAAADTAVDMSTKVPEDATRPPVEDVIDVVFPPETVVVEEETGKKLRGKLPDDFPHRSHLEAEGVTTYAQVRKHVKDGTLTGIPNIAAGRAVEIEKAVKE